MRHGTIVAYLALFVALGGAAYAVTTAPKNSVTAKSIKRGAVRTADVKNENLTGVDVRDESLSGADLTDGSVTAGDVADGSLGGAEIADGSLGGTDIDEASLEGVTDTCPSTTIRLGRLCVGGDLVIRTWKLASDHCRGLDLWLPTVGQATALGFNHDIPGITLANEFFWTDSYFRTGVNATTESAWVSNDLGDRAIGDVNTPEARTLCVTNPSDAR